MCKISMKKYENFTAEKLKVFVKESESFRELAIKCGYSPDTGNYINTMKQMVFEYKLDVSHFKGHGHTKNIGNTKRPIEDYLTNKQQIQSYKLKERLFKEGYFDKVCMRCGLTEWLGNPIPLELHHKDGNKKNNQLSNLEILCPNCHCFTETYKSKNRKYKRPILMYTKNKIKKNYCIDCGKEISRNGKRCHECAVIASRMCERPDKNELKNLLFKNNGSFTAVSKLFNVSDNTVRKWCKFYGISRHSKDYKIK